MEKRSHKTLTHHHHVKSHHVSAIASHNTSSTNSSSQRKSTASVSIPATVTHSVAGSHHSSSHHYNPTHVSGTNAGTTSLVATKSNQCALTTTMKMATVPANPQELAAASLKSARNKNEEAINDLRQRIPEIENLFDVHSRIGNGTFSTVLLGTLKKDREQPENMRRKYAIKHHIPTSHPDRIVKELECMHKIGGRDNVVGINCVIRNNESVAFIMPYLQHDRFIDFFSKMPLIEVQNYMKNLLIALRHVHKFNVIHRDVKPSNFLYNRRKRQFLLVDFGLAQPVPSAQAALAMAPADAAAGVPQLSALEGKRARESDEITTKDLSGIRAVGGCETVPQSADNAAKRIRCCSGDQVSASCINQAAAANPVTPARFVNSCSVVGGSPFKMPLKQLNEISNPTMSKETAATAAATSSNNGIYETPLQRQVKSAAILSHSKMYQKLKQQHGSGRSSQAGSNLAVAGASNTASTETAANKYNTNRNLSTNTAKCYCYGNPQVCNICLIKKEIHASRAGTPGYRPPEVLLKYPDQTTAVDIWASGVIFLSILSSVYPFFKAPNDYVALAEMVTIFGDKSIRKTAFALDRLVSLSQKTKPLDLRKLCVRFRNRTKFSAPELLKKYQRSDGSCEVCKNCDQFFFNCLCTESHYNTEPLDNDDPFPQSAYDLLYKLLEVNPHKRITAEEALKHPFFDEIVKGTQKDVPPTQACNNNNNNHHSNRNNASLNAATADSADIKRKAS